MNNFENDWELVAQTDNAHKAIACENYENEQVYNMSGIQTSAVLLGIMNHTYREKVADMTLLEIGCGTGRETKYLSDCFKEVIAVDASKTMVEKGRDRIRARNIIWMEVESGKLRVDDNIADIVYSFIVFQHCLADTVKSYFKEAFRVLKPGGRFIFQLGLSDVDHDPVNYSAVGLRTKETLIKDLEDAGFMVERLADNHFGLHICKKLEK